MQAEPFNRGRGFRGEGFPVWDPEDYGSGNSGQRQRIINKSFETGGEREQT